MLLEFVGCPESFLDNRDGKTPPPQSPALLEKNSHISSNGLIRSHGELLVGKKKHTQNKPNHQMTNQPTPGPFFNSPKKRNTGAPVFFGVWVCFLGGKKPPNLRNINSSKKNISPWAEHPSQLLGGQLELSLVYTVKLPGLRDGSQMFLRLRAWRNLAAFCCAVFSAKTRELPCWGEGVGQKNLRTISSIFSKFGEKPTGNKKKLSIDHSIVRYLLKCSFHAIFPQVRKHKKNNWEPRDIRTGNLTLVVHFLLAGRKNLHATWGQMGSNRIKCNWQPVLGMCALGDRSVPVAPEDSLTKPRFGVTSAEVVINCPGEWSQVVSNFLKNKQTNMSRISSNSSPPS